MPEEIKELGLLLKAKREGLHLTLKEIENGTSIRSGYLDAIEEGKIAQFVSGVYAQGFTKQYAAFLGVDPDELMRAFPEAFRPSLEKHEFSYGIGTLEARSHVGGSSKWTSNLLWGLGILATLLLAGYLAKTFGVF